LSLLPPRHTPPPLFPYTTLFRSPNLEAAVVKDVGTCFEQEIPEVVHALLGVEPRLGSGSQFERTFGYLVEHAPSFSLRGGTRERSEEHTSELQSRFDLVCRLLLE